MPIAGRDGWQPKANLQRFIHQPFLSIKHYEYSNDLCSIRNETFATFISYLDRQNRTTDSKVTRYTNSEAANSIGIIKIITVRIVLHTLNCRLLKRAIFSVALATSNGNLSERSIAHFNS